MSTQPYFSFILHYFHGYSLVVVSQRTLTPILLMLEYTCFCRRIIVSFSLVTEWPRTHKARHWRLQLVISQVALIMFATSSTNYQRLSLTTRIQLLLSRSPSFAQKCASTVQPSVSMWVLLYLYQYSNTKRVLLYNYFPAGLQYITDFHLHILHSSHSSIDYSSSFFLSIHLLFECRYTISTLGVLL